MLEDEEYEVRYDRPDLSSHDPVVVELSVADVRSKGINGVQAVVQDFEDRHAGLPVVVRAESQG
jgi:hypothetical protein